MKCIWILSQLATPIIAVLVAYVAWQQWRVARNKLRLDLFDRRYRVYEATGKFLWAILDPEKFEESKVREFDRGTSDAQFLFKLKVLEYLKQIRICPYERDIYYHKAKKLPPCEDITSITKAFHDRTCWLSEQLVEMNKVFEPYVGFSNIK